MKKALVVIFWLCLPILAFGQFSNEFKRLYLKADEFMYADQYQQALPLFLKLDSLNSGNANINFNIGMCYFNLPGGKLKALPYLEKAMQNVSVDYYGSYNETTSSVFVFYYLGKINMLDYKFDAAIDYFKKFKYYLTAGDADFIKDVDRLTEMCYVAIKMVKYPISIRVDNLGENVNTLYKEHSPVISADGKTLYFTSRRVGTTGNVKDYTGNFNEDIYMSTFDETTGKWSVAVNIGAPVNTKGNEATCGLSYDGKQILLYKGDQREGDLYVSSINKGTWSAPKKLSDAINTKTRETHATFSPDGNSLYFVSNREGGLGGRDIWMSQKNAKGDWGKATNLGPKINTSWDEESPFMLPDGVTLYFSSKGHESMGGYDIFSSTFLKTGEWTDSKNIGYPLNTPDDDLFFNPFTDGKIAFYATDKMTGYGQHDIYRITIIQGMIEMAVLTGVLKDTSNNKAIFGKIEVTDKVTGQIVASTNTNENTGDYLLKLPVDKNYYIKVTSPIITFQDSINIPPSTGLEPMNFNKPYFIDGSILYSAEVDTIFKLINVGERFGDRFVLKNIYFDFDKSTLRPESNIELDKLAKVLSDYPMMVIELSGHTDNVGGEAYNKKLSTERAKVVVEYLISKDIAQSRLSYKGFGFEQPLVTNSTPEGRQINRRTEFRLTGYTAAYANNPLRNPPQQIYTSSSKKFYIIAGSYTLQKNAERYNIELKQKGYKSEILGLNSTATYRVTSNSYSTKEEAIKDLPLVRQNVNPGAWIYSE
ncbi:MAG: OmpA family protein [Bacteroidota bacterium]